MVFFQGSLQEGIAAALQQAKSVVCFVTGEHLSPGIQRFGVRRADHSADGEAESRLWEDDFLAEEEVSVLEATLPSSSLL